MLVLIGVMACRDRQAQPPPPVVVVAADATQDATQIDAAPLVDAAPDAFVPEWRNDDKPEALAESVRNTGDPKARIALLDEHQLFLLWMSDDCLLAYLAARRLADKGDTKLLPSRGLDNHPVRIARKLCLISTIDDLSKRREFLREFLPPTGTIRTSYEKCRDDLPPGTKDPFVKTVRTRATLKGDELLSFQLNGLQQPCRLDASTNSWVCAGDGPGTSIEVALTPAKDNQLYISTITGTLNTGCY